MSSNNKKLDHYLMAFFQHQLEIKMYHFQTKHFGAHKATDEYLCKFQANFDRIMEVAQGNFGQLTTPKVELKFTTLTDKTARSSLDKYLKILQKFAQDFADQADLLAIRDELQADAQQLKYLLIFK